MRDVGDVALDLNSVTLRTLERTLKAKGRELKGYVDIVPASAVRFGWLCKSAGSARTYQCAIEVDFFVGDRTGSLSTVPAKIAISSLGDEDSAPVQLADKPSDKPYFVGSIENLRLGDSSERLLELIKKRGYADTATVNKLERRSSWGIPDGVDRRMGSGSWNKSWDVHWDEVNGKITSLSFNNRKYYIRRVRCPPDCQN